MPPETLKRLVCTNKDWHYGEAVACGLTFERTDKLFLGAVTLGLCAAFVTFCGLGESFQRRVARISFLFLR